MKKLILFIAVAWLCIAHAVAQDITLKGSATFPVGAAVNVGLLKSNATYKSVVDKEYNSLTPENAMKMGVLHPQQNTYDFTDGDYLVSYAQSNNKRVHGHTLVWHQSHPSWVTNFVGDSAAWENLLKTHIQAVVTHFKGKVVSWDVVNEAFQDDGTLRNTGANGSIWMQHLGSGYIARSFGYAHEADPDAVLFYNDYGHEYSTTKLNAIKKLVDSMVAAGVPIHGVGLQLHTNKDRPFNSVANALDMMRQTGLKVHIAELDIAMNTSGSSTLVLTAALTQQQTHLYKFISRYYKTRIPTGQQYGITMWNVGDRDSWIPASNKPDWPCLFDSSYQKKQGYQGMIDGLAGTWEYMPVAAQAFVGTYTDLGTTGTPITKGFTGNAIGTDNDNSAVQNIGFPFKYNGTAYNTFVLSCNGYLKLGSNAPSSGTLFYTVPSGNTGSVITSNDIDVIYPFNHDLKSGTPTAEYRVLTTGNIGSRVCTVQFKNVADRSGQYANMNFQVKLYEEGSVIEFVYGSWTAGTSVDGSITAAAGVKGIMADSTVTISKPSGNSWSGVTFIAGDYASAGPQFNTRKTVLPEPGRTFRFTTVQNGDYRSAGGGVTVDLNSSSNWQVFNNGWIVAAVAPDGNVSSGNTITIQGGDTWTNTAVATIPQGVTLVNQGIAGSMSTSNKVSLLGTYVHYTTASSSSVIAGMAIDPASTFMYKGGNGITPSPVFNNIAYGNLAFEGAGTLTAPAPANPAVVNGTFTVNQGWTVSLTHSTAVAPLSCNGDIVVAGSLTVKDLSMAPSKTLRVITGGSFTTTAGYTMVMNSGSSITLDTACNVIINGLWINNSSNTFALKDTILLNGTYRHNIDGGSLPKPVTYANTSTIEVTGIATAPNLVVLPLSCGNVVWDCPAQTASNAFLTTAGSSSTTTINGDLTVRATGTGSIYLKGASTTRNLVVGGAINVSGGTLKLVNSGGSGDQSCTVNGDVTVSGGSFILSDATNVTGRGLLNIQGSLMHTAGQFGAGNNAATGTSVITFTGNNTGKTIRTTGIANGAILVIDKTPSGTISLAADMTIHPSGILKVVSGTMAIAGKTVRLQSAASGSATVATITGNIDQSITGSQFISERYMPARRGWNLLTVPLGTTNTIRESWQNGGNYIPGAGTFITGPGGANGLDDGASYTLKTFDPVLQSMQDVTSTTISLSGATGAADNKGYFIYVTGDRDPANLAEPNRNTTTLSASGLLQTGTQSFAASATAGLFTLLGNPYASPVDFSLLTRTNVAKRFYVWDPSLNKSGGFVLVDDMDDDGSFTTIPASSQSAQLQQGQAFFVQTIDDGGAAVTFNEEDKATVMASPLAGVSENLQVSLYLKNADNTTVLADGALASFNSAFDSSVTIDDGRKMANVDENLAFERKAVPLAFERRPEIARKDTLFMKLWNTTPRDYRFTFNLSNFPGTITATLEDAWLHTSTPVSLSATTSVDFSITADPSSAASNRFMIVLTNSSVLPVNFTMIKAVEQRPGVQVDWTSANESDLSHYEVEKATNGVDYRPVAMVAAKGSRAVFANYSWYDANPAPVNYYRVKGVEASGGLKYSAVVCVKLKNAMSSIEVYPNPVVDKTLHVQLVDQPKGKYDVLLYNQAGQQVYHTTIDHGGGSATQVMILHAALPQGIYQVRIGNGFKYIVQPVLVAGQ